VPAPFVDRLVIIAHHHNIGAFIRQQFDEALLPKIHILVFIHDDDAILGAYLIAQAVALCQNIHRKWYKIIEREGVLLVTQMLKLRVDEGQIAVQAMPCAMRWNQRPFPQANRFACNVGIDFFGGQ
jgi:hypothetical protein